MPIIGVNDPQQNPATKKETAVTKGKSLNFLLKARRTQEESRIRITGPKTKESEAFLEGSHGYFKAMALIAFQNIPVRENITVLGSD